MFPDVVCLGREPIVIFLYLEKGNELTNPLAILEALGRKGVRAHLLRWLSEFLTNPSAQVSFQGHVSTPHPYNLGTPPKKGSCLSPFLFNILMEELTTETYCSGVQLLVYADDRALFIPRRKHQFVASRALEVLKQRCATPGLKINTSKTRYMTFDLLPLF
ncbi:uncharacterized protein LOC135115598 [Scylla paramamosain]|uniref:uncharacterized protein LOC135115598 n=1 Tax=Scylla paramamosain TaxID=85552 RepID=UPI0030836D82